MAVAIVKTDKPEDARRAVELLGGMEKFVSSGEKVIVKPNVCAGKESDTGAVTDPEVTAEVCRMVAECGAKPVVAESPIYPFKPGRVFRRAGYEDFEAKYGFPFVDIDNSETREVRVPGGHAIQHSVISLDVLNCDKLINVPVLKTHLQTVVSLGLKNLKGVVVSKQKHIIHLQGLDEGIVDLNTLVKCDLTIVDGIMGMEGTGGPTNGRAVRMDVIVAGDNVVEVDSAVTRIMGGDPRRVDHIRLAAERGLGSLDGFEVLGESIKSVSKKLDLPRTPKFNRLILSGVALRVWDVFREPWMRLIGGERILKRVELGDLIIDADLCDGCRQCLPACPVEALAFADELVCDRDLCIQCFCCAEVCPQGALKKKF